MNRQGGNVMEITLEKIELVKDRTGVSYKEAKAALEAADGSVVDAIINLEEVIDSESKKTVGQHGAAIADIIKNLIKKGNISRIVVKKKDGEVILNIPVNAGIIASLLAPGGVVIGIIASFGFKCTVEVVKTDGTIIDVSDRANDAFDKALEKGSEFADVAKQKGEELKYRVQMSDTYEKVKDKAEDVFEKTQETVLDVKDKFMKDKDEIREEMAEDFEKEFEDISDEDGEDE